MFKILSLDGGGLKGLYTIKILEKIQKEFGIKYYEYFDMIIGTSTGSIIATLLSLGKEPSEIYEIYLNCYKKIFPNENKKNLGLFSSIYDNKILEEVLKEYLKDFNYKDLKTKLLIPSVNLTETKIHVIKSYGEESNINLKDAIMASSAAPPYFKPHIFENKLYLDGSIYANNPTLLAIEEALNLGNKINDIKVLSIGTGICNSRYNLETISNENLISSFNLNPVVNRMVFKLLNVSKDDIGMMSISPALINTAMRTSIELTEKIVKTLIPNNNYVRINDEALSLKLDKIPLELIENIDTLYENNHKEKLNLFFSKSNCFGNLIKFFKERIKL